MEHHIQLALQTNTVLLIVFFFQIEKVFDSVLHIAILHTLFNKEIEGRVLKWIADFLSGRHFKVRINGKFSHTCETTTGVPQGAILSPLQLNILMSDFPNIKDTHCLSYADDISAFVLENSLEAAVNKLQSSISVINSWLNNQAFHLNSLKCRVMMFTRKKISVPPSIYLENTNINFVFALNF